MRPHEATRVTARSGAGRRTNPQPGSRRRGEDLEQAIYAAVVGLLAKRGYGACTMEGIAAAAKTGKAALYRRWSNVDDLIVAALDAMMPAFDPPDTGTIRDDLIELLDQMVRMTRSHVGRMVQHIFTGREVDRSALKVIKHRLMEPRKEIMRSVIQRGMDRGEVRPDIMIDCVCDVGPAVVMMRQLETGKVTNADVENIVDEILMPLLRPDPTSPDATSPDATS